MRLHASLLVALLVVAGCQPAAAPPAKPTVGPALAPRDDHAGHDHAGHDHEGHDHDSNAVKGEASPEEGHEGHHHPETFGDLVAELDRLVGTVREGLEAGVREKADASVHEFGHLVEDVAALAKEAKLPEAVEAAVVKAGSDLFDAFDKLDQAIHGTDDVAEAWKGQAEGIDKALGTLKAATAK